MKRNPERPIMVRLDRLDFLRRNPQYLTPRQMESLKKSIERDGFLAPIVAKPGKNGRYTVISGNHRVLAAREVAIESVPVVIFRGTEEQAKRVALNLNLVHGEPTADLLAPFLAELERDTLKDIHLEDEMLKDLGKYDESLEKLLHELSEETNKGALTREASRAEPIHVCTCPTCGQKHSRQSR